jgi:hypothetical protein
MGYNSLHIVLSISIPSLSQKLRAAFCFSKILGLDQSLSRKRLERFCIHFLFRFMLGHCDRHIYELFKWPLNEIGHIQGGISKENDKTLNHNRKL